MSDTTGLMDQRIREAAEADINTLFQNLSGQDQFLMTKFLDNMIMRMERMEDENSNIKEEREKFQDKVDDKLNQIMAEVKSYSELNSSLITKTNQLEKVVDKISNLVMSHEKSISKVVVYLKEIHADMKKYPLAELNKDVDAAHDKIREHDRVLTNLHSEMREGFDKVTTKIDEIGSRAGNKALKAWQAFAGILGTALVTWFVTNLLSGNIQLGG